MGNTASVAVPELPEPPALAGTPADLEKLKSECTVHLPGTVEYDTARYNGTWSRDPESFGRPSAIAVPTTAQQVYAAVQFCVATGSKFSVACGRHTPSSIKQGVLMIDLTSGMHAVVVDPVAKTVTVGGGANIGAVDAACKPHTYIIPVGRVGSTGCAGQMLCTGAHGYIERTLGLGVDYMISATVVLTTGIVQCSETENPDLFWGIRGGQTNFGIVTEMVFRGEEAPSNGQFYCSQRVYLPVGMLGMASRQGILDYLIQKMDCSSVRQYNISATLIAGGGGSPAIITEFWFGDNHEEGAAEFKKGPKYPGIAVADNAGVHDYWTGIQKWANGPKGEDATAGAYYFRGVMCQKFTPAMGKAIVSALEKPFPKGVQPLFILDMMGGGKSQEVDISSMALPTRPNYWFIILCQWDPKVTGPEGREYARNWCRDSWQALMHLTMNDCTDGEQVMLDTHLGDTDELMKETMLMGQQAKVNNIWGSNLPKMRQVKNQYDPDNFFGSNIESA